MIAGFVITFRETLEAVLVVGIVLAYLVKVNQTGYAKFVWWGVFFGILVSLLAALIFVLVFGGLSGRTEEILEGLLMFVAAGLLTTMILWMAKQGQHVAQELEQRVTHEISERHAVGILALVFFAVLREGIETVIFLGAASRLKEMSIAGPVSGVVTALIAGWLFFWGASRLRVKWFFRITSAILILFAGGLVAQGVHEFQEASVLPVLAEHIWDINWLIDEKGSPGSILNALFGYNGNPSFIEVVSWAVYLAVAFTLYRSIEIFPGGFRKRS